MNRVMRTMAIFASKATSHSCNGSCRCYPSWLCFFVVFSISAKGAFAAASQAAAVISIVPSQEVVAANHATRGPVVFLPVSDLPAIRLRAMARTMTRPARAPTSSVSGKSVAAITEASDILRHPPSFRPKGACPRPCRKWGLSGHEWGGSRGTTRLGLASPWALWCE